jgi:hypothetical protein
MLPITALQLRNQGGSKVSRIRSSPFSNTATGKKHRNEKYAAGLGPNAKVGNACRALGIIDINREAHHIEAARLQ